MAIRSYVLSQCPLCVKCQSKGRITAAVEVDHIVPVHKEGTDDFDNLQSLCHDCHAEKTATEQGKRRKPEIGLDGWPVDTGGGQLLRPFSLENVCEPSL